MVASLPTRISLTAVLFLFSYGILCSQSSPITFRDRTNLLLTDNFSGVSMGIADMNGDGKDDIVRYNYGRFLNVEFQTGRNQAFDHKNGGAIANFSQWSSAIADVDRDGDNDIVVGGEYDNIKLIRNQDGNSFTSTNIPNSSIFMQGSNFVDINNDGDIDLFACNDDADNREYVNNGSGGFVYSPNLINTRTTPSSDNSGSYASIWTDHDNDGDLDLYISKCRQGVNSYSDPRRINMLFENDGNNNFTEVAAQAGLAIGAQSWLADFADIDNDGDMDVFVANHFDDCQLLLNNGNGTYTDISDSSGLLPTLNANSDVFAIQSLFRDFNNDGYVDLLFTGSHHFLFYNNKNRTFTASNPFGSEQIESCAIGDLNHDGFLDIYAGYAEFFTQPSAVKDALFMNNGNSNNFIAVTLEGTESNINAIGARVEIHGSFGRQIREVRSGEGYGIMNTFTQHFGLGSANSVSRIVVKWPSGNTQTTFNPQINQFHSIIEKLPCAGEACNDGDPCTIDDVNDAYCNCAGTLLDSDNDGVCNTDDICPGYDDNLDSDNDGIPNGCDNCANDNDNLIGQACNDNNPCTTGETYDNNCNCSGGTVVDSDNDGICDSQDQCPGYNDNVDSDNDNIPNGCDTCPNLNNNFIGQPCNDGNPCTVGERYNSNCGCSGGVYRDADNDGVCAGEDSNDNDPCVPNSSSAPCNNNGNGVTGTTGDTGCDDLSITGFEGGNLGIWLDGGTSARLLGDANFAASGNFSFYLQGNEGGNSSLYSSPIALAGYQSAQVTFSAYPYSMESGDRFHFEIATNGSAYTTYKTFRTNTDFINGQIYTTTINIAGINLTNNTRFRFRSQTNESADYIMLDEIHVQGCGNNTPNCNVGTACSDGDPCTSGETYDSDCNCTGGTSQDSDNDGICNAQDSCPNLNNNLIGQPCNDGNPCTTGEKYNSNCGCSGGTTTDNDGDGYCASQDPNDNDPCVPNSNNAGCSNLNTGDCNLLNLTTFENNNMGIWVDGGNFARIISGTTFSNSGIYSFYVQGNEGALSSIVSQPQNFSNVSAIKLSFNVLPYSVENGDRFLLEFSTNGTFYTYKTYTTGSDLVDAVRKYENLVIDNVNFNANTRIRFRSVGNSTSDYFILDDIRVETCSSGNTTTPSNCTPGSSCNDGDSCTTGEYYDSNCNCIGGSILDSDNDGVCNAEDQCPAFDDNLIGTPCNDGNPCTTGETYNNNCGCSGGTYTDADGDGYCAGNDPNDNDPCVPNSSANNCNQSDLGDCTVLNSTNFEGNNLGIWTDGGNSARLFNGASFSNSGSYSFYIQDDNGGSSSLYSAPMNLSSYSAIKIKFHYYAYSVEAGDKFYVELNNGNGNYYIIETFRYGQEFNNGDRIDQTIILENSNLGSNASVRFRAATTDAADYIILDDISIEGCTDSNNPGCQVGGPCNDNNVCTVGETYDSNCNCTGGTIVDNDNDGFCAANDSNDNDPCVPNSNNPGCNTGSLDCDFIATTGFEGNNLGIWNDGGSSARILSSTQFANTGSYTFYIQGNDGAQSSLYTDPLSLAGYNSVQLSFNYLAYSLETNDRFHVEISNGGNYFAVKTYVFGIDFQDNDRKDVVLNISGINLNNNTKLRFRMQGNSASDYIMLDDIKVEACTTNGAAADPLVNRSREENLQSSDLSETNIYPNPANEYVIVESDMSEQSPNQLHVFDITGKKVLTKTIYSSLTEVDISGLDNGQLYLFRVTNEKQASKSMMIYKN